MKKKYESINWSKVDAAIKAEFDIIESKTKGFSDEELNKKFEANFNDLMSLVPDDAIKSEAPEKKETTAKEAKPKKEKKEKAPKAKKEKVEKKVSGKPVEEISAEECLEAWRSRREAAKKSARKSKTVSVFERISDKVESAIEGAIKNTPAAEIKDDPKKFIDKVEAIGDAGKEFLQKFRTILGSDYEGDEIKSFEKHFDAFVSTLRKKYQKK
jgi:hypothetical protein